MTSELKKKLNNKKGFTLAELLVVVAIIAVLVAIAIPTFTAATEKADEAVAKANCRSALAEATVKCLTEPSVPESVSIGDKSYTVEYKDGVVTVTGEGYTCSTTNPTPAPKQ